jgi:hypothetical protein
VGQPRNSDVVLNRDFLAHYGVKGMRWGVVRDSIKSNPEGAAKKAAGVVRDLRKTKVRTKEQAKEYVKTAPEHKRVKEIRLKQKVVGVQALTNKDLQEAITRMNLEMTYKNLKKAEFEDSYLGAGGKFVAGILKDAATDAASSWVKRPGSNFSGRSSARAGAYLHPSRISIGSSGRMAIGS